jgi:hypothetical protein
MAQRRSIAPDIHRGGRTAHQPKIIRNYQALRSAQTGQQTVAALVRERFENPRCEARIALFLGAGADISAGGLTFRELKRGLVTRFGTRPVSAATPDTTIDAAFQDILTDTLRQDDRGHVIDQIFRDAGATEPSDSYRLLILLAARGAIDALVTTNFDCMLERAEAELGLNVLHIMGPGIARPPAVTGQVSKAKVPYLKLHGDTSARIVPNVTDAELANQRYDPAMVSMLDDLLRRHVFVFVGYSGWDVQLAQLIGTSVAEHGTRIFICNPGPLATVRIPTEIGH